MDVPELLATLVFEGRAPEVLWPVETGPGEKAYRTPAREFELGLLDVTAARPFVPGPGRVEILLGLSGDTAVRVDGTPTPLGQGRAILVPASVPSYGVEGKGRVCRARGPA